MGYDGFGVFTRAFNWVADKAGGLKINAARMDGEFDNFATGMNQVILRNGIAPMTGDFKVGSNKITGIGAGTVGGPSLSYSGDVMSGIYFPAVGVTAVVAGGVERARANSTGWNIPSGQLLGVGTNTPRTQLDVVGITSVRTIFEDILVSAAALTGAVNIDAVVAGVIVYTSNAVANWTFNVRGDGTHTLDSIMAVNQSISFAIEVPQGVTPKYCTAVTVDGAAPGSLIWFGGAPLAGNASGVDVYTVTVYKLAANTFAVRASLAQAKA